MLPSTPLSDSVWTWDARLWAEPPAPSISKGTFLQRVESVRDVVRSHGLDAILVSHPASVLWLSDFEMAGTFYFTQVVVPLDGHLTILAHRADAGIARKQSWVEDVVAWAHGDNHVSVLLGILEHRLGRRERLTLGAETDGWFRISDVEEIRQAGSISLIDVTGELESLRTSLLGPDIVYLARAAQTAEMALAAGIAASREGVTESEIAASLQRTYHLLGGQDPSIWPSVASGPRAAIRRAVASDRRLREGETLILDVWASSHRYTAACGCTLSVGAPSEEMLHRWDNVVRSLSDAADTIARGVSGDELFGVIHDAMGPFAAEMPREVGWVGGITFPLKPFARFRVASGNKSHLEIGNVLTLSPALLSAEGCPMQVTQTFLVGDRGAKVLTLPPLALLGV